MKIRGPESVCKEIESLVTRKLDDVGLMYRVFSRVKSKASLERKLDSDNDYGQKKKVQDLIGIRVVVYFGDDVQPVRNIVTSIFDEKSEDNSIDVKNQDQFSAVRYNVIYSLSDEFVEAIYSGEYDDKVDSTFELQIRTVFSEGWHEVEHDLRYKYKEDWIGFDSESRLLNGVFAALESNEWTMVKLFDELAYSHYKDSNWSSMLRQKYRLRFVNNKLSDSLLHVITQENMGKSLLRFDRSDLIKKMNEMEFSYPLTMDNLVFFINFILYRNNSILDLTPNIMKVDFGFHEEKSV